MHGSIYSCPFAEICHIFNPFSSIKKTIRSDCLSPRKQKKQRTFFYKTKFTAPQYLLLSYFAYASTGSLFLIIALTSSTLFFVATAICSSVKLFYRLQHSPHSLSLYPQPQSPFYIGRKCKSHSQKVYDLKIIIL